MKIGIIFTVLIVAGVLGQHLLSHPITTSNNSSSSPYFDYIVVIVMENKNLNETYGKACIGNCTYITQLANTYALALNYSGVAHGSGPNYQTLTSGANYSLNNRNYIYSTNIIDRIEATGRTWKAYMEDYTGGGCSRTSNQDALNAYENEHNPFLFYPDINKNSTRCSRIVNANPGREGYLSVPTVLLDDLNNVGEAPNFMWLSPNDCNNSHQTCTLESSVSSRCVPLAQCTSQGNEYLSMLVPKISNSRIFMTRHAALFITWDEGYDCPWPPTPPSLQTYPTCIDLIPAIFVGPDVKRGYVSDTSFSHYSFVKTLEVAWSFPSITPLDDSATSMTGFFAVPLATSSGQQQTFADWIAKDRCRMNLKVRMNAEL